MADDRHKVAIEIIARDVLALAVRELDLWETYAEIGEHDWDRVMDKVLKELAPQVDPEQYKAAYEFLSERAENSE